MKAIEQLSSLLNVIELTSEEFSTYYEAVKSNEITDDRILSQIEGLKKHQVYKLFALAPTGLYEPTWMHTESYEDRWMKVDITFTPKKKLFGGTTEST